MHMIHAPEHLDLPQATEASGPQHLAAWCRNFIGGDVRRATIQLAVTASLFAGLMAVMLAGYAAGLWWVEAVLALPAALFLLRLFVIQHDCGHGSFFPSRAANDWVGRVLSLLTFTPYDAWRLAHNLHHAASGNLDRRGLGSIDTITVREYRALPFMKRLSYRLYRHPLVMLLIGMPIYMVIIQRIPFMALSPYFDSYQTSSTSKISRSIIFHDGILIALYGALITLIGWKIVLTVFLPVLVMTSWIGGWLFFIQHQFEDAYWQPHDEWEFRSAALHGSSYYALPPLLQWLTGNIGLHHIHHLCSAIPNYRLQECLNGKEELQNLNRMTIRDSLRSVSLSLWDEDARKMVGFKALKGM
jgi:omega-6 fatty acid desaturase (delta-12 desaturase)